MNWPPWMSLLTRIELFEIMTLKGTSEFCIFFTFAQFNDFGLFRGFTYFSTALNWHILKFKQIWSELTTLNVLANINWSFWDNDTWRNIWILHFFHFYTVCWFWVISRFHIFFNSSKLAYLKVHAKLEWIDHPKCPCSQ